MRAEPKGGRGPEATKKKKLHQRSSIISIYKLSVSDLEFCLFVVMEDSRSTNTSGGLGIEQRWCGLVGAIGWDWGMVRNVQ